MENLFQKLTKGKKIILEFFCLSLLIGFMSCEKTELESSGDINFQGLSIEVKDNLVHFKDGDQFDIFIDKFHDNENEWNLASSSKEFTSMENFIDEISEEEIERIISSGVPGNYKNQLIIIEEGSDKYLEPVIDSRLLRNVVNEDGNFVIGDTLLHFSYDKTYFIPIGQYNPIEEYASMAVKTGNIQRQTNDITPIRSNIKEVALYCKKKKSGNHSRRLRARLRNYYAVVYEECSVDLKNMKRILGVWTGTKAHKLSMNGQVTMEFSMAPLHHIHHTDTHYISIEEGSEKKLEVVFFKEYSSGAPENFKIYNWNGTDMTFKADQSNKSKCKYEKTVEIEIII